MFSNKYAGNCNLCGKYVGKGEGFYDWGVVYCGEPQLASTGEVSSWRLRFSKGVSEHKWLADEIISFQMTFTPTKENAEKMFERYPSAFPVGDYGLDVCPVVMSWMKNDDASAEAQAEKEKRDAERAEFDAKVHARLLAGFDELVTESRVRSITQVIEKVLGASVSVENMTLEQLHEVTNELHRRIDKREASKDPNCSKCGGTGAYWKMGAGDKYFDDGCWRCLGTGKKVAYR